MSGPERPRRLWRFPGGLRLAPEKSPTRSVALEAAGVPPRLVVSLAQHRGSPATPVVTPGERVARGQLLARGPAAGACVHAPAAGTVTAVAPHEVIPYHGADRAMCVELATDAEGPEVRLPPLPPWQEAAPGELAARIHEAGIVGLGGAAFPTHVKLLAGAEAAGPLLIVNGAECEPYIACDEALMRSRPERVVTGARIAARAAGARRILLAVEDHQDELVGTLRAAAVRAMPGAAALDVVSVPTVYPEGGERQLVRVLTGREVPSGGYPSDIGLLVLNVGTVAAIGEAVCAGRPLVSRVVTVTGRGIRAPRNLEVLVGTPVSWLVARAGGYAADVRRLVSGGPMMGVPLPHDELPVTKGTNCLLGLVDDELRTRAPELPCIRCMACAEVCPAQLLPQQLHWQLRAEDLTTAAQEGLFDCIECGCCAEVCPSHIPLVEAYRRGKREHAARAAEQRRADRARERFEARRARLAREQAEREARLEARRGRLADERRRRDEVAAAVARARSKRGERREEES